MSTLKAKWTGSEATLIRLERNGTKVQVKPGEIVEIDKKQCESIRGAYKQLVIVSDDEGKKTARVETGADAPVETGELKAKKITRGAK